MVIKRLYRGTSGADHNMFYVGSFGDKRVQWEFTGVTGTKNGTQRLFGLN